ncbi:MAG: hypothetical protein KGL25_08250 [Gammaproteobacteria bacterium]|nr:hypothetical protein [Gammaproteobacteria bacterium]
MIRWSTSLCKATLIACIVGSAAQAQTAGSHPANPAPLPHRVQSVDDQLRRLDAQLHLSSEQQARVRAILDRRQAQLLQLRTAQPVVAVERFAQVQAIDRATVEQIGAVLTDEQRKVFVAQRQPPGETRVPEAPPGGR